MTPADQLLAERLLAEKLVSPEKLEACRQTLRKAEHAGNPPSPLAQELLRQRLLPAWRIGLLLLELHSGFEDAREDSGGGPTAAAPSDPSAALARYPVSGQLGAGGMGQVLAIHDPALGREMAAKLIRGTASSTMKARFIQEAQITGRLEHPGIVPVHELGMTEDGRIYFTMKRVRGQDLSKSLAARPLFELLQILLKVCDALAYAHSQGVIHRDLKPANIMVGRFGEVQVVDWGLAKVVDEPDLAADGGRPAEEEADTGRAGKLPRTQAGAVLGTYPYMAPEQARGEIDRLDRRTDVYALGAVLYEMLAGCPPYGGSSHAQILARVLAGKLLPPGERAPDCQVPPELEAVTLKAMARRPAERYDTVVDMQRDIEAHLEGRLLQAAEYNTWQVVKKWAARHKPAVAAAAASLAAVILGFVASSWQLHQVRLARDNERQQKNVALAARKDEAAQRKKAELREQEAQIARKDALASRRKAVAALEERDRETREKEVAQRKGSAAEQVHKAMELYTGKGDRAMVSKLLAEAEQVYPDHSGLLRMRGRMALDRKEWPKARGLLERALKQDPKDYVTHFLLYRWHAQQGRGNTRSAEKHVWAAAKHGTQDSAIGLWGLGMREIDKAKKLYGSAKTKALEQGVEFCTRALAKRADFAWAFRTRGQCYMDLKSWEKALADSNALVGLLPEAPNAYVNRGELYQVMKRYDEALADCDTAIRLNPGFAGAYFNRGTVHQTMKRYDKALADYDKAISIDPRYAMAYSNRGGLYVAMKRHDKALADYDKAISIDARRAATYNNRASLYIRMKRYDKALADYDKAISIDPRYAMAYQNRGGLHFKQRRYRRAIADWERALPLVKGTDREKTLAGYIRKARSRIK